MTIQQYISSGILELYTFDLLSDQEKEAVVANLRAYPELREELVKIELAVERYIESYSAKLTPQFRTKLSRNTGPTP